MKVSIVTINYNNEDGLRDTLQSVSSQTYQDIEHVIYDGSSVDGSVEIIKTYGHHLAAWKSEANGGIYYNQNRGLEMATGDYCVFLNSGDYLYEKDSIERMVDQIQEGTDIAYGNLWLSNDGELSLKQYPSALPASYFLYETLPHPSSFIKTTFLKKHGGYDERLKICSDWKFFYEAFSIFKATFQHIDFAPSVFGLDGISSNTKNRGRILNEKIEVLTECFPSQLADFKSHQQLTNTPIKKVAFINRLGVRLRSWIKPE